MIPSYGLLQFERAAHLAAADSIEQWLARDCDRCPDWMGWLDPALLGREPPRPTPALFSVDLMRRTSEKDPDQSS